MLEKYFVKPQTVDRVRASWIGAEIERYVEWLCRARVSSPEGLAPGADSGRVRRVRSRRRRLIGAGLAGSCRCVRGRVGRRSATGAPARGEPDAGQGGPRPGRADAALVVLPVSRAVADRSARLPFAEAVPGFFEYLVAERGLRPASVGVPAPPGPLRGLSDADRRRSSARSRRRCSARSSPSGRRLAWPRRPCGRPAGCCGCSCATRTARACSAGTSPPRWSGRRSTGCPTIPRSISWAEVERVLAGVDRRTPCGKRDYAILLLLVIYGLRGREVAALTLDDIDWKRERLAVPERKAGHSTAFPLSPVVGEAIVDYLRHGRPGTSDRHVFFRAMAPVRPDRGGRGVGLRPALPAEGGGRGTPPGIAHAAPHLRAASRGRRLRLEDDR